MSVNLPVVNAPYLTVSGLELAVASTTTLTMASGRARNSTDENDIILSSSVTINAATHGLNALDTGTFAASTLYAIYAVGDSSANNPSGAVMSLASSSAPTLPVGYDMYRLIGYARTDGSTHFLVGYWYGSANWRYWTYDVPLASAVTAGASATYAPVDLTGLVPAIDQLPVLVETNWTANAAADTLALQGFNAVGDTVKYIAGVAGATAHSLTRDYVNAQLGTGAPKINYKVSAGTVAINVAGYMLSI
jgi:hypothetical protein